MVDDAELKEKNRHLEAFQALRLRKDRLFDDFASKSKLLVKFEKEAMKPNAYPAFRTFLVSQNKGSEAEVYDKFLHKMFTQAHSLVDFLSFVSANEPVDIADAALVDAYRQYLEYARSFNSRQDKYVSDVFRVLDSYAYLWKDFAVDFDKYGVPRPDWLLKRLGMRRLKRPSFIQVKEYLIRLHSALDKILKGYRPRMISGMTYREYAEEAMELNPRERQKMTRFDQAVVALINERGVDDMYKDLTSYKRGVDMARLRVEMAEFPDKARRNRIESNPDAYVPMYRKYLEWGMGCLQFLERNAGELLSNLERRGAGRLPQASYFFGLVRLLPSRIKALRTAYAGITKAGLNYAGLKARVFREGMSETA